MVFSGFFLFYPQRIVGNEPKLDCFQQMYRRSDADNFGSVRLMVREKIDSQTDRRTDGQSDNIRRFFPIRGKKR